MPFSWMRVPNGASPKVRNCMGGDTSKTRFAGCVRDVVSDDGGKLDQIWFEQNGKYAHVHISWDTPEQKAQIVFDLEADQVVDLVSVEAMDAFARERGGD